MISRKEFLEKYQKVPVEEYANRVSYDAIVSVIVVTYQHANYIRNCLDSILMQEVDFEYEILLGDDDSTDDTREICIEYAERYPDKIRLFLHSRENNIHIAGRPTGRFNFLYNLFCARGKYVAICEGDDYWTDASKLKFQVNFLEENGEYSMICHRLDVAKKFTVGGTFSLDKLYTEYYLPHTSNFFFQNNNFGVYLKNLVKLPGAETALLYINTHFGKIYYSNRVVSEYRIHEGGIHTSANNERIGMLMLLQHRYIRNIAPIDKKAYLARQINFAERVQFKAFLRYLLVNYTLLDILEARVAVSRIKHSLKSKVKQKTQKFLNVTYSLMNRLLARPIHGLELSDSLLGKEVLVQEDILVNQTPDGATLHELGKKNLYVFRVKDVLVHSDSSIYKIGNKYFTNQEKILTSINTKYENDLVPYGRSKKIRIKYPSTIVEVDEAIALTGHGSFNYFHLLLENISRLFLINNIGNTEILIPSYAASLLPKEWLDLLQARYNIRLMDSSVTYRVKNAYIPDYFINTPFDVTKKYVCDFKDYAIAQKAFGSARQKIVVGIEEYFSGQITISEKYSKIYIKRESGWRTFQNQDQLMEELKEKGFEIVEPSSLTLLQQFIIFKSARIIVGGSGAALSNIIFSHPGTKVISWLPERLKCFSIYSTLAALCDIDFINLTYTPVNHNIHSSYTLDIDFLLGLINKVLNEID